MGVHNYPYTKALLIDGIQHFNGKGY
jgi:hypothetical protein